VKPKSPCHVLKVRDPGEVPVPGERRVYALKQVLPENSDLGSEILAGRRAFIFHNDFPEGEANGQLLGRGTVIDCSASDIEVEFDGLEERVPLSTRSLDFFVPQRVVGVSEVRHSILYDVSVVRRKTTQSAASINAAVYTLSGDCGAWLDIYHF